MSAYPYWVRLRYGQMRSGTALAAVLALTIRLCYDWYEYCLLLCDVRISHYQEEEDIAMCPPYAAGQVALLANAKLFSYPTTTLLVLSTTGGPKCTGVWRYVVRQPFAHNPGQPAYIYLTQTGAAAGHGQTNGTDKVCAGTGQRYGTDRGYAAAGQRYGTDKEYAASGQRYGTDKGYAATGQRSRLCCYWSKE
eukprot:1920747-Rhodomonas_salina.1